MAERIKMSDSQLNRLSPFLYPLVPFYAAVVKLRNLAYDCGILKTHRLSAPVISVGNVSVGGTGKTPVTLSLAKMLTQPPYSLSPAILSRGYHRKSTGYQLVANRDGAVCDWTVSGDEPQIYARNLNGVPVAVDADRARGGHTLIRHFSPSAILLDDAFQHRRIQRDLDIVLLDSSRKIEAERLLPAGMLREPLSALNRADLIVLTHFTPENDHFEQTWDVMLSRFGEEKVLACRFNFSNCSLLRTGENIELDHLKKKRVIAFCGIAKPSGFSAALDELGLDVPYLIRFPDHHCYKAKDVQRLAMAVNKVGAEYLITTEKDAVKLDGLFSALPILALQVEIEWLRGLDNLHSQLRKITGKPVE